MNPASRSSGLVSTGIYSRLRHPRYLDYMLSFLGLAVLTGAAGYFLLAFITILLYLIVVPLEERELREQYRAQYDAYARTVPRFVPHFSRSTKAQRLRGLARAVRRCPPNPANPARRAIG